jgi:hypothetical protein
MQLWFTTDNELDGRRVTAATLLPNDADDAAIDKPRVIPVAAGQSAIAVLLVPTALADRMTSNGVPLAAGMHLLRHTDRLEYAGRVYWVAASAEICEVPYDAAVHGDDLYCFLTKARLRAGEPIVVCPGRPGVACDAKYRKAAWEMAQATNTRFKCPRCGFEPGAGEWRPTLPRPSRLPQLFELARKHPPGAAR